MKVPNSKKEILPNGMRYLEEQIDSVRSIAIGLLVGTGSANETESQSGISHLIEHMTFKGTRTRSAFEIAQAMDAIGGKMNAATSKEYTCFYAVVLDRHIDIAVDVLADIFLNSLYDEGELKLEKLVVLEEIKMYEDTPDELIHDLFAETILDGHPLARPTLGQAEIIKKLSRQDILDFMHKNYTPSNLIISVAGNCKNSSAKKDILAHFGKLVSKPGPKAQEIPSPAAKIKIRPKKTEQVHLCLGTKGISHTDPRRYAFSILDNVLGGNMSSRLFQEIREKRGLAYSVYSYNSSFINSGIFSVYAGTSHENYQKVIDLILAEFRKLKKQGITKEELARTKEYLKGNLVLGLENTSSRMSWMGKCELYYNRVLTIDEIFAEIDAVTQDDIIKVAQEFIRDEYLALAMIGNIEEKDIAKELKV